MRYAAMSVQDARSNLTSSIAHLIASLALCWSDVDADIQDVACIAAMGVSQSARMALAALLPYGALKRNHARALAQAAHPNGRWDVLAEACAAAPGSDAIALGVIARVCDAPAPPDAFAASAWSALDADAQTAFVRTLARDTDIAVAFGHVVAESDMAPPDAARRPLLRAMMPAHVMLESLQEVTVDAETATAWLPPPSESIDETERVAWQHALASGWVPFDGSSSIASITSVSTMRHAASHTALEPPRRGSMETRRSAVAEALMSRNPPRWDEWRALTLRRSAHAER